jgi:hypothetical protein
MVNTLLLVWAVLFAGRGADLFIIDDPHSEQEAKTGRPRCISSCLGVVPVWPSPTSYAGRRHYCRDDTLVQTGLNGHDRQPDGA